MERLPPPELPRWLAEQLPFERSWVEVGSYHMHLMEAGEGTPVLMLHGNPTWGFLWRKVAQELKSQGARVRLIVPDLVGLGFSDKPRDPAWHTLDHHANQVAQLIEALGLKRLVFVGQDWGGPIGGCALARLPGVMAGAVILNTSLGPPRPGFKPTAFHRFAQTPVVSDVAFRLLGFPQRRLWMAQGEKKSITKDVTRAYVYPLQKYRENAAPLALARMVPDSLEHTSVPELERCQKLFEEFRGPSEIVWGDKDPILGRLRGRTERLLPHAKVTRTDAGHFLQEQVPKEIAQAIARVAAAV